MNGHTVGFRQKTQKLEQMVPFKSTAEEVSFDRLKFRTTQHVSIIISGSEWVNVQFYSI